ncbi:hypothetical protein [Methylibium sp.]|uniref:hypothetical protein n=1 Tax=Methylibium sp. TaxID=2067992 RepID=UPI003D14CD6F
MKTEKLDKLIWALIFGGMALLMLGLWVIDRSAVLGHGLAWGGGGVVLVGALLIRVRSRMPARPAHDDKGPP